MGIQRSIQGLPAQLVLIAIAGLVACPVEAQAEKTEQYFYPDDPVCCAPRPLNVSQVAERKTDALYDFLYNSFAPRVPAHTRAGGINTLGEVLDSEWFTNRHARTPLSLAELKRGPGDGTPPSPPYVVVGAKLDGITPGFRMRDAKGTLFFVKPDPLSNPEMATASDVMGARFFHAIGYNTPENYIVHVRGEEISISPEATRTGDSGKPRPMIMRDINNILWKMPRAADGSYRMIASRAVSGKPVGPFQYTGTRSDDPNDIVLHENRRELRGLFVFCAWLNHTDAKSINSLDTLVKEDGREYVKHYLLDFGSAFGSDSDMPKNVRFGNAYIIPSAGEIGHGILNFGLVAKPWEKANYGDLPAIGRFEASAFDPDKWVPNYPNPAFAQRTPEDEFWAASIVMSFKDEDIRAIVETAQYSDPRATDYVTRTLIARRQAIGRAYFSRVLPLDRFRVNGTVLEFEDLAVLHGFEKQRSYRVAWFRFDNNKGLLTAIPDTSSVNLPPEVLNGADGSYFAASFSLPQKPGLTVFLLHKGGKFQIVGIERQTETATNGPSTPGAASQN